MLFRSFRLYAESSGTSGQVGSIQTSVAITNPSANPALVTFELNRLSGVSSGLTGSTTVPGGGQVSLFLNQIPGFASLQTPFEGFLRLSSTASISVAGLRGRYNERGDFLITTTPPLIEAQCCPVCSSLCLPPSTSPLFFPHIADSGGYTTQFILFSAQPGSSSSGTMQLFNQSGGALGLTLQ